MGHVIAVVPASGGVGATTLAAAVAVRAAAAERSACLVDLDVLAGRAEVVFGAEREGGWRWDRLVRVAGVVDGRELAERLPSVQGVAVLSHGAHAVGGVVGADGAEHTEHTEHKREHTEDAEGVGGIDGADGAEGVAGWADRLPDVVSGLARAHDVTVLDAPRDDRVLAQVLALCDAVVLVLGTQPTQIAGGARTVDLVRRVGILGGSGAAVVTGSAAPSGLLEPWVVLRGARNDDELEDVIMDELDVPVVDFLRDDPRCVDDLVRGTAPGVRGRGPVTEVADRLLLRLVGQERAA